MRVRGKGFTLIEMAVVIVVLAIISAVAVPKFIDVASDAKKAKITSVAADLRTAIDLIYYKALILGIDGKCYDRQASNDDNDPAKDQAAVVEGYLTCSGYPIAYVDSITRLISLDDEYTTFNFGEKSSEAQDPRADGVYRVMIISAINEFTRDADATGPYCQVIYQPNSLKQIVVLDSGC